MGKNQIKVLEVLTELKRADVHQIAPKLPDFFPAQVQYALKALNDSGNIKVVARRKSTKANIYEVAA